MATLIKKLKNTTGSSFDLLGATFVPSVYVDILTHDDVDWRNDSDIITKLASGDLVMNDGTGDLSSANGLLWLSYDPEEAFSTRFQSESERSNNFSSKNVQDAIEEARISAIGTLLTYPFISNGNTSDKWLSYSAGGAAPSNDVPMLIPQDTHIKGITFSNSDDDVDTDVEVYVNGTLEYTWEIRNKRVAWNVGAITIVTSQGDRVSVYLKKYIGGTGDSTAQNPLITLLGKFVNEAGANSGIQYGL